MPQMSPLLWCNLFMAFSALLLITVIKIFFKFKTPLSVSTDKLISNKPLINWSW